jgi:hypothetical protein
MVDFIRRDRDCAKICYLTASFVTFHSSHAEGVVRQCEIICRECAEECEKHDMDHCQECARACRACEEACRNYHPAAALVRYPGMISGTSGIIRFFASWFFLFPYFFIPPNI